MSIPGLPVEQRSITAPDGTLVFGHITLEVASAMGCNQGEIRLLRGFQARDGKGFGYAHLSAKPARQRTLDGIGFRNIEAFVWHVARDYDAVTHSEGDRLTLLRDCRGYSLHVVIEWRCEREFWSVVTGLPKRAMPSTPEWQKVRTDRSEPRSNSAESLRFATLSLPKSPAGKGS